MIQISKQIREEMTTDALGSFPDECCGFLLGKEDGNERVIEEIIVVNNAQEGDKRRRFEIAPSDYLKAEQQAEEKQLSLLGVYHSHPDHPSIPSEEDREAAQPYFSYIILSVTENKLISIQSWLLNEEFQFEEEKLLILNTTQS